MATRKRKQYWSNNEKSGNKNIQGRSTTYNLIFKLGPYSTSIYS